jgi:hypothetical protein
MIFDSAGGGCVGSMEGGGEGKRGARIVFVEIIRDRIIDDWENGRRDSIFHGE